MKRIFYKNYLGFWVCDDKRPTQKRLEWIKKHKAENGVATIQLV
jgi:hypothetical protein